MEPEEFLKTLAEVIDGTDPLDDDTWASARVVHRGLLAIPNLSVSIGRGDKHHYGHMDLTAHSRDTITMSREHYEHLVEQSARLRGLEK